MDFFSFSSKEIIIFFELFDFKHPHGKSREELLTCVNHKNDYNGSDGPDRMIAYHRLQIAWTPVCLISDNILALTLC